MKNANTPEATKKGAKTIILIALIAIAILLLGFSSARSVPSGFVGIRTQFSAVIGVPLSPGLNLKLPLMQDIELMDCRIQKIEADSFAASSDLQIVTSKIAVNFSINPAMVQSLFQEVGTNYRSVVIDPAVQEVVKMVTAQYTAENLIAQRGEVSQKMTEMLTAKISSKGIIINDFNVLNFDFSEEFNNAIEQKQIAQQQALKAQQDLARIKIEAEQKIVQAQAEAESLKLQKPLTMLEKLTHKTRT